MQYFQKYLNDGTRPLQENPKDSAKPLFTYVKQWTKSTDAIIFRLNNCVLQINFHDKSQIVIYTEKAVGVYSDSRNWNDRFFFSLGTG